MTAQLVPIAGDIRDYAWGTPGGISRLLARPATERPEAELWLGAHPSAPSRAIRDASAWPDLAAWERAAGATLPYLLKVLSAASPLSLQAHPTPEQAAEGFAHENALGIPLDARERNYKDPYAKPELIVALEDGFEALCGFRPVAQTRAVVGDLAEATPDPAPFLSWQERLARPDGIRQSFEWLLDGGEPVTALIDGVAAAAASHPRRWELAARLAAEYPGDPGIAVALMLNHVTLAEGEALWLPAGNIHAYLRGTGMELMGSSDNVLRGGLTPKHVDVDELRRVLDFTGGEVPRLHAVPIAEHAVSYRPRALPSGVGVAFELVSVTADTHVDTGAPSIAIVVDGAFDIGVADEQARVEQGESVFVSEASPLAIRGAGRLFLATA